MAEGRLGRRMLDGSGPAGGAAPGPGRRVLSILAMFAGALAGTRLLRHTNLLVTLRLALLLLAVDLGDHPPAHHGRPCLGQGVNTPDVDGQRGACHVKVRQGEPLLPGEVAAYAVRDAGDNDFAAMASVLKDVQQRDIRT
ncbi:hypothetical protein J7I97_17540 [Streptomyces sp. ISL-87]|uniref:hypothetical protein n=1 Tax=Streptomyces sp. ISL-87 TaxID=2819188 RepID=UPI001BED2895|nr:hypothetical protein [Streptomyces sp. ISL-87]MBT2610025.1 hypothetical protein [Streptomyces sp. ISL-87]